MPRGCEYIFQSKSSVVSEIFLMKLLHFPPHRRARARAAASGARPHDNHQGALPPRALHTARRAEAAYRGASRAGQHSRLRAGELWRLWRGLRPHAAAGEALQLGHGLAAGASSPRACYHAPCRAHAGLLREQPAGPLDCDQRRRCVLAPATCIRRARARTRLGTPETERVCCNAQAARAAADEP